MNGLNGIRSRVNALRRKFALELAIIKLCRLAEDFISRWHIAIVRSQEPPDTHTFILHVGSNNNVRSNFFMRFKHYIDRCIKEGRHPQGPDIVHAIIPRSCQYPLPIEC